MAFFRSNSGGGGIQESAPLWENPNPSTQFPSSNSIEYVTITLNESYDNYDMLRIYFHHSTTDTTLYITDIDPSIFVKGDYRYTFGASAAGRNIRLGNAEHTTIVISANYQLYYRAFRNSEGIPIKITGLKNAL